MGADQRNIIEPFDSAKHDRSRFSCGVPQVDNYFRGTANKLARANNVRLFVMTSPDGDLIGFYALNAHAVEVGDLPAKYARTAPRHGNIPAAYISMIGVASAFQGRGYGGDLLVDALIRIARASEELGLAVVILDILDDGDADAVERRRELYGRCGFTPLQSNGLRMFLPIATVRMMSELSKNTSYNI